MGSGSSIQPKEGVLANPRVAYSEKLGKKTKKAHTIDAPVLIDLGHGSIRYRQAEEDDQKKKAKKELPFEGDPTNKKGHYFYHPRLNDFSEKASVDREDPHKFVYVMKGPNSARHKKVFYVYGKGWNATDGKLTRPTDTRAMGQDPAWPQRQKPNDVYYNITFTEQSKSVPTEDPIPGIPNRYSMAFAMSSSDTVKDLKVKIAHTILKSSQNIHVCFLQNEISDMAVVGSLPGGEEQPEQLGVQVTLMDR